MNLKRFYPFSNLSQLILTFSCSAFCLAHCATSSPPPAKAPAPMQETSNQPAPAKAPAAATTTTTLKPEWLERGSVASKSPQGLIFYGVGLAQNIKNPGLLRTTADNRARAELAKIFNTFSETLMQDYQAAQSGTANAAAAEYQEITQALKTATNESLVGSKIVDHYLAGDGTLYALAALKLDEVKEIIQAALSKGVKKANPTEGALSLEDIFAKHATTTPVSNTRVVPVAGNATPGENRTAATAPKSIQHGAPPRWIEGADNRYPELRYLCAVGFGNNRESAEDGAFTALARIFKVHIQATTSDFLSAYNTTNAPSVETESLETLNQVSTDKILTGAQIKEVWDNSQGTLYALACMERESTSRNLKEQIQSLEQEIQSHLTTAAKLDKASRVRELGTALNQLLKRESLNSELRLIDPQGIGVKTLYTHADVAAAFNEAVQALKIGLQINGPYAADFKSALTAGLIDKGYLVSDFKGSGRAPAEVYDIVITADIQTEDLGPSKMGENLMYLARGVVHIDFKNLLTSQILGAFSATRKEGSRSLQEAERIALRKLANSVSTEIASKIDAALRGEE